MAVQQIYDGAGRMIRQRDLRNVASVQGCTGTVDKEAVWRYGHDANQRQNFGVLLSENDNFVECLFSIVRRVVTPTATSTDVWIGKVGI